MQDFIMNSVIMCSWFIFKKKPFILQVLNSGAAKEKYPMFSVVEGCAQEYGLEELCARFSQQTVQVQRFSKRSRGKKPTTEDFVVLWLLTGQPQHFWCIYLWGFHLFIWRDRPEPKCLFHRSKKKGYCVVFVLVVFVLWFLLMGEPAHRLFSGV